MYVVAATPTPLLAWELPPAESVALKSKKKKKKNSLEALSSQPFPSNLQPLATTYLLSITIILPFLEFHVNGNIQSIVSCVWLLPLGICL